MKGGARNRLDAVLKCGRADLEEPQQCCSWISSLMIVIVCNSVWPPFRARLWEGIRRHVVRDGGHRAKLLCHSGFREQRGALRAFDGTNAGRLAEDESAHLPVSAPRAVEPGLAAVLPGGGLVGLVGRARLGASQRDFGPCPHLAGPVRGALGLVRGDRSGVARPVRKGRDLPPEALCGGPRAAFTPVFRPRVHGPEGRRATTLQGADPRGAGDLHQLDRNLRATSAIPHGHGNGRGRGLPVAQPQVRPRILDPHQLLLCASCAFPRGCLPDRPWHWAGS